MERNREYIACAVGEIFDEFKVVGDVVDVDCAVITRCEEVEGCVDCNGTYTLCIGESCKKLVVVVDVVDSDSVVITTGCEEVQGWVEGNGPYSVCVIVEGVDEGNIEGGCCR